MFTFEIERKPFFFSANWFSEAEKRSFFSVASNVDAVHKHCSCSVQALFAFRTSVVRIPYKRFAS